MSDLTDAQWEVIWLAAATLATVRVPHRRGRPRNRPRVLVADKGYDGKAFHQYLCRRGIRACIPRRQHRRRGRPPTWRGIVCAGLSSVRSVGGGIFGA